MRTLVRLTRGELKRMVSYRILPVALATSCLWVGIYALLSAQEALRFAPLLIYMDAGLMTVLLIGAFHHLERGDGTIRSMMVLPVSTGQILASKGLAAVAAGLLSAAVSGLALYFLHGITLNYALLVLFVALSCAAHAAIGFSLALRSADFSSMLGYVFVYMFALALPAILMELGVIPERFEWLLLFTPSFASLRLISHAAGDPVDAAGAVCALASLTLLCGALYRFHIVRAFKRHAAGG